MSPELEDKLVKNYPKLFVDYGADPKVSCMAFGCECGDGWYQIIDDLCYALTNSRWRSISKLKNGELGDVKSPQMVFDQIKEKFGALRIYYHFNGIESFEDFESPDETKRLEDRFGHKLEGMVEMAEAISHRTCESCGDQGAYPTKNGWIKTLCMDCHEKNI